LANDPEILLADEPTGSLDPASSAQFLGLLDGLRERSGLTVVVATHDQSVAAVCDRRLAMVDGRLASA
jgi:putative ABC transport system ATP-binding protein